MNESTPILETSSPDFSQFTTSSVQRRLFYDQLFYGVCIFVSVLSIVVLGILLGSMLVSAIPVLGPHSDSFVCQHRLAIVNRENQEQIGAGDLVQGIFKVQSLSRGGLGESNDQIIKSPTCIGVYSFEIAATTDEGDNVGLSRLRAATGENNIFRLLDDAGFILPAELNDSQAAMILLESDSVEIDPSAFKFEGRIVKEGKLANLISSRDDWQTRLVLGFDAETDFGEFITSSMERAFIDQLGSGDRAGLLNCMLSVQFDSVHSAHHPIRNLNREASQLISGDIKIEGNILEGLSRRKSRRQGFDLGSDFELEYCPLPETDASPARHAAHFLRETTKTDPAEAGVGPAIAGSLWVIIGCILFALPIGIATAIFLEEFKPTNRILLMFHNLLQLNIANLAGVPSIVYGILGLTAFVYMFSDFNSNSQPGSEPIFSLGEKNYYQFLTEGMEPVLIPVADPKHPPELVDGMTAETTQGETLELNVIAADEEYPEDDELLKRTLMHDAEGGTISKKPWYYLQIPFGRGVLAASLTLMLVILPVIIIATQEALRAVPSSLREGALGLGSTRWQVVRKITLPAAIASIMTGAILSVSRAIGEAAPILILCGIVYVTAGPSHLMDDYAVLPVQIFYWSKEPIDRAALINFQNVAAAGIVVLVAVLLSFNAIAILIRQLTQKPLS